MARTCVLVAIWSTAGRHTSIADDAAAAASCCHAASPDSTCPASPPWPGPLLLLVPL